MSRICRFGLVAFAVLYAAAFVLFLIGTYGWFGTTPGPLAGIFLIPLGLPWNRLLGGLPSATVPTAALLAPALNLLLLWSLCRWRARK